MAFWIAAVAIGLAVTALLLSALLRPRGGMEPAAAYDLRLYREQLREVDHDLARGLIAAGDADRLRTEVSRRVLEADRALNAAVHPGAAPRQATLAIAGFVVVVMIGAVLGYLRMGAPSYPDMPRADRIALADEIYKARPTQAALEAAAASNPTRTDVDPSFLELMDKLRAALKDRPDDQRGHGLLARNEAALGNYRAAATAQAQLIALKGDGATANDHAALGEYLVLAAGGFVSIEAEAELTRALEMDPANGLASYYAGLMFAQVARPDRAFTLWASLLQRSGPDDPWVPALRAQLPGVAEQAGEMRYVLPPLAVPGPSAEDIEAAAGLSDAERQEMARGMVERLNQRLATEGGSAQEWARLIGAYGVLGETDKARQIWSEAQQRFASQPGDMETLRAAAVTAGVAE
ncbi:MAG: c-type cytochrome biogenesis protein CcmI [Cereibacter sphaeroides]|uniref:C-type cytochrome biogenesis protein CcmI n=1 Tax=Cereibacter sphaeroides TaxID=1063 RepID=A0A2W5TUT7_CERSP|nr:MAG: c-type cytochrome biogenesis protein CcmI [Cereibacter sphaeroides]